MITGTATWKTDDPDVVKYVPEDADTILVSREVFKSMLEHWGSAKRVREILDFHMKEGDYETQRVLDSIIDEINKALDGEHSHNYNNNTTVTTGES
jgi:DNA-binding ferritin-like protein